MNSRLTLPPASRPPTGPDWRRIFRYGLLGTFIMLGVLLYPAAVCSWDAYGEIPLGEDEDLVDVTDTDRERVERGAGFWDKLTDAVGQCYAEEPITGQDEWKMWLFTLFLAITVVSWILDRVVRSRRRRQARDIR